MTRNDTDGAVLAFAHIGDPHVTQADRPNLMSILAQLETRAKDQLDVVVLPGDCADNGLPGQYALIATALRMLSLPVHVIPGDRDMAQGDPSSFYDGLPAETLPAGRSIKGCRCLFLDVCGAGKGGSDLRLGADQMNGPARHPRRRTGLRAAHAGRRREPRRRDRPWLDDGIAGTRLGPNRNGRKW